jgi:hypothetical protein
MMVTESDRKGPLLARERRFHVAPC